jgi:alpha/beta hydrolase family protein
MPEIQVPLASYTGWNLRSAKIGAPDEMYTFTGSWIPFARTKAQRVERHDPRLSIEDRYATEQEYLKKIDQAAQELQRIGFVLETDLPSLHSRAAREWQYRQSVN